MFFGIGKQPHEESLEWKLKGLVWLHKKPSLEGLRQSRDEAEALFKKTKEALDVLSMADDSKDKSLEKMRRGHQKILDDRYKELEDKEKQLENVEAFKKEYEAYLLAYERYLGSALQVAERFSGTFSRLPLTFDTSYIKNVVGQLKQEGTYGRLRDFFIGAEREVIERSQAESLKEHPDYKSPALAVPGDGIVELINSTKEMMLTKDDTDPEVQKRLEEIDIKLAERRKINDAYGGHRDQLRKVSGDQIRKDYLATISGLKDIRTATFKELLRYSGVLMRNVEELDNVEGSNHMWSSRVEFDGMYGKSPLFAKVENVLELHRQVAAEFTS